MSFVLSYRCCRIVAIVVILGSLLFVSAVFTQHMPMLQATAFQKTGAGTAWLQKMMPQGQRLSHILFGQTPLDTTSLVSTNTDPVAEPDSTSIYLSNALSIQQREVLQNKITLINQMVVANGVTSRFDQQVKQLLLSKLPNRILTALNDFGYKLHLKHHITDQDQEREARQFYLNERGGLNEPKRKITTIAERVHQLQSQPPIWLENIYWQNSVLHELGHVIADHMGQTLASEMAADHPSKDRLSDWGASEHDYFIKAWEKDFQALSPGMKSDKSPLAYFLQDHLTVPYGIGRQETFAECVDILLRGSDSAFNNNLFNQNLPNALKATQTLIEQFYNVKLFSDIRLSQ